VRKNKNERRNKMGKSYNKKMRSKNGGEIIE
jgi:hypothetical protein